MWRFYGQVVAQVSSPVLGSRGIIVTPDKTKISLNLENPHGIAPGQV